MQIQLVLNLQSIYHKIENLQLILNMQHAGPYFHLGALSCFNVEARSERFAINVIQISITCSRYVHWTSCSNSYYFLLNYLDIRNKNSHNEIPGRSGLLSALVVNTYLTKWELKLSVEKTVYSVFHLKNHSANYQLNVKLKPNVTVKFDSHPSYTGICLDRFLSFRTHLNTLNKKVSSRVALIKRLAGVGWGASFKALRTSCLALAFVPAEYCAQCGAAALTQNSSMYFQTSRCALSLTAYEAHPPPCPFYLASPHLRQSAVLHAWKFAPKPSIRNIFYNETLYLKPPKRLRSSKPLRSFVELLSIKRGNYQRGKLPHQYLQLSNPLFTNSTHNHQDETSPEMPEFGSTAWGLVLTDLRPTWNNSEPVRLRFVRMWQGADCTPHLAWLHQTQTSAPHPAAILRGGARWAMAPPDFCVVPRLALQFFLNFPFKFVWLTYAGLPNA